MFFLARRIPRAAACTRAFPPSTRPASSSATRSKNLQFAVDLHAVASLRREPTALYDIAANALGRNKVAHSYIVEELGKNPTLDDTKRWDLILALVDMRNNSLPLHAQKIAVQPSHDAAIDVIADLKTSEEREAAANELLSSVRTKEAPFLSAEHVIRLYETLEGDRSFSFVFSRWIGYFPAHFVRLGTNWERAVFDRQRVCEDAARQLRLVEDWFAHHYYSYLSTATRRAFMYAYGATRVADDDVAREWDEIVESGEILPLHAVERGLASTRTLDGLNTMWAQIQTMSVPPSPPNIIPFPLMFYALNLARLGARDQAEDVAKRYPVHDALSWLVDPYGALDSKKDDTVHKHTRANRERANDLVRSGLDVEDVIFMLSPYSPYRDALRGIRSGSAMHNSLVVKEQ
ncbi:hypothetical protein EXIGLDRAFT_774617 [Exidia glandulosa HHB12029]|uniref:Uncharacterized protein n=1 Tax=Exidia glandulosa HHB12029 TaxID=1314781 RepID=A0A165EAM4_EXIGL|nr:hypothetical protein EXIGLDRAFT_774617 [Exidia glandulosa HHB12029]